MATQAEQFATDNANNNVVANIADFDNAFAATKGHRDDRGSEVIYIFTDSSSIKRTDSSLEVGRFAEMLS